MLIGAIRKRENWINSVNLVNLAELACLQNINLLKQKIPFNHSLERRHLQRFFHGVGVKLSSSFMEFLTPYLLPQPVRFFYMKKFM